MFATGETVSLAEWIIEDTYLSPLFTFIELFRQVTVRSTNKFHIRFVHEKSLFAELT